MLLATIDVDCFEPEIFTEPLTCKGFEVDISEPVAANIPVPVPPPPPPVPNPLAAADDETAVVKLFPPTIT